MSFFADFIFDLLDALVNMFVSLVSGEIVEITDLLLGISDISNQVGG